MESTDDHGRPLSASPEAAAWYREAQRSADPRATERALREALDCEPAFALASADFSVLAGTAAGTTATGIHAWERHHIEIVRSVQSGNRQRAIALLADHLSVMECDPIATRIVGPEGCGSGPPGCHPARWTTDTGSRTDPKRGSR